MTKAACENVSAIRTVLAFFLIVLRICPDTSGWNHGRTMRRDLRPLAQRYVRERFD
jgi:hypothetical protein